MSDATPDALRPQAGGLSAGAGMVITNTDDAPTIISSQKPRPLLGGSAPEMSLCGQRLGPYELIEPIGAGGMATVIRATDTNLDRTVALKVLPSDLARDGEHRARFQTEARAAAKLDHENIARIYGSGEEQGLCYIAFEFVEGRTLRDMIVERGALPAGEATDIILQVANGLAHAATRGVVHRDIKPANVIVMPGGRAKIVDMGLARHLDHAGAGTQSGVTLGTFDYMAPEQAIEPRAADERSDIYSLGCTYYHALTGHAPTPDGTAAQKLHHHQHVAPPDPRTFQPDIPADVVAVLSRMMAKSPGDRYPNAAALAADLETLSARRRSQSGDAETVPHRLWAETAAPATRSRQTLMMAAAAALGIAAVVAVLEMTRLPSGPGFHIALSNPRQPNEPVAGADPTPASVPPRIRPDASDVPRPVEMIHAAATADELRELFAEADGVLRVRLTGTNYDLTSSDGMEPAGLVFQGRRLEIETEDPTRLATIQWTPSADDRAALTVSGRNGQQADVLIRGIRFQCAPATGDRPLAAIAGSDIRQLDVERCSFVMPDAGAGVRGAGAIVIDNRDAGEAPTIRASECLFVRGRQAIQLTGRGNIVAANCAFGPHRALVQIKGAGAETAVRLEHCSALLDHTTVVAVEDGAAARITAGHCLFSRPVAASNDQTVGDAVLVRQSGGKAGDVTFRSLVGTDRQPMRNGYHNLSAFWIDETAGGPWSAGTIDEARARPVFRDEDAFELPSPPWVDPRPLASLAAGDERGAFAVNLKLARLRLPRAPTTGTLGVMRNVWGPSFAKLEPLGNPGDATAMRSRIVDPAAPETDAAHGVYPTLSQALADARPNEIILIKKNGSVPIEPADLAKSDIRLTLRPFPGYRPALVLNSTADADAAMFRIHDGTVRFEGLQIVLRGAGTMENRNRSVVAIGGVGKAQFQDCVVTLEGPNDSVVAIPAADADLAARTGDRRGSPQIRIETCFIRGRGDLASVRGGKRFDLEVDSSLVALDGSVVSAVGQSKDPPATGPASVRLRRVTALTEHVLELRMGRDDDRAPAAPAAVQIACDNCLLAASAGRPLVQLDGAESDEQVRQLIAWSSPPESRPTYYANPGPALLDVQPAHPDRMPQPGPYDRERWLAFTHDRAADPFVRLKFGTAAFVTAQPNEFRPKFLDPAPPGADECGAPIDRLPAPMSDE